jgi:TonB family protein
MLPQENLMMKIILSIIISLTIYGCSTSPYKLDHERWTIEIVAPDSTADPTAPTLSLIQKDPNPLTIVKAETPDIARRAGLKGEVYVRAWVTKSGTVRKVQALKVSGEVFLDSALEAAIQYKFKPMYSDGKPIDSWVEFPVDFK